MREKSFAKFWMKLYNNFTKNTTLIARMLIKLVTVILNVYVLLWIVRSALTQDTWGVILNTVALLLLIKANKEV